MSPVEVGSNVSIYLHAFGFADQPQWLVSPKADDWAAIIAAVIAALAVAAFVSTFVRGGGASAAPARKRAGPSPQSDQAKPTLEAGDQRRLATDEGPRDRLEPKIRLLFDPNVAGCVVPTMFVGNIGVIFFRIKVDAIAHGGVGPCVGRLVSVEKDGSNTRYAESLQLTWAPAHGPDALSRIIADKTPTFLDVCFVTEEGVFGIATPGLMQPNSMNGIFEAGHRYGLKIVVAVSGHASEAIDLTLDLGPTSAETRMSASIVD